VKGKGKNKGKTKDWSKREVQELAEGVENENASAWGEPTWEDSAEGAGASNDMHSLCALGDHADGATDGCAERVNILIDSGAGVNALPLQAAASVAARPMAPGERTEYVTASGGLVRAEGTKRCTVDFLRGEPMNINFTSMGVRRPIASVSKMVGQGLHVVFAPESAGGSYVYTPRTGESKRIFARNGVYEMPVWIRPGSGANPVFRVAGPPAPKK